MKYFRMSWEEIMYERSWLNITMLSASIPDYSTDKQENKLSGAEQLAAQLQKQG